MSENEKHPLQGIMQTSMENLKNMIDVNTIIGNPITTPDGSTILPISKVSFGFASGGSDFPNKAAAKEGAQPSKDICFGGGSGAGVTINPVAFLVISSAGTISMLPIDRPELSAVDKVIDMMPGAIDKIKDAFAKKPVVEDDTSSDK